MDLISYLVLSISLVLFAQAVFSVYLMLYTWEHPERLRASEGPSSFLAPRLSFSVLLPARHEETVIFETIRKVWEVKYPSELIEIVVICHEDDTGTIAEAEHAVREIGSPRVRTETFSGGPINKPRGLNVGLERTTNEIVTIFDAEDDIDPDVFNVVNTVMLEEEMGVVQSGVQLMNFRDSWFSVHNCQRPLSALAGRHDGDLYACCDAQSTPQTPRCSPQVLITHGATAEFSCGVVWSPAENSLCVCAQGPTCASCRS